MAAGFGRLVNGEWLLDWDAHETSKDGDFQRESTVFHNWVTADGSSEFGVEAGRYHLYLSRACPWAHRTAIMRSLKGLEDIVPMTVIDPVVEGGDWVFSDFPGCGPDPVFGAQALREIYLKSDPSYTGNVTVPVLLDTVTGRIVNNESRQIMRMFDKEFGGLATKQVDYCPDDLADDVDRLIDDIYEPINNGVYRCGFARTQKAYDKAVIRLFASLDRWEEVLGRQRYLCGNVLTEADWCFFTTLYRFDAVYYVHFKCSIKRIEDYPNLSQYLRDLFQHPGVRETCNLDHVRRHYYLSHRDINPSGILPAGPLPDFARRHDRERFGSSTNQVKKAHSWQPDAYQDPVH